jgi:YVTN family beta-propeller protein
MRMPSNTLAYTVATLISLNCACISNQAASAPRSDWLSPIAIAAARDGGTLFIACSTANRVLVLDTATRKVTGSWATPEMPLGLVLSPDGNQLFVTCAASESKVLVFELPSGKLASTIAAGHTANAPVISPDGRHLFVCNRFDNDVSVIDLSSGKVTRRIPVQREPVSAAITADGKHLLVANHLHNGRADIDHVAAVISVLDVEAGKLLKELTLPNGSGLLNDIRVSPDGQHAVVTHILARYPLPTTQLDRGWMNTNAKTIVDLSTLEIVNTVLLDNVDSGAANPWGVAWSADSKTLVIAHAGTHELSFIDFPAVLAKLAKLPASLNEGAAIDYSAASRIRGDVPNDLSFLVGIRQRIKLPQADRGPRSLAVAGNTAFAANFFSDSLTALELSSARPKPQSIPLNSTKPMDTVRLGQFYFHDASICFQGWQSCSSCHPGEARVDALNWDLLNDGIGNPKNNKSLLLSHQTPPAMSIGVRETAESAVRAGIRHILFTVQPEKVAVALDEYLKALTPVPSPYLVDGKLSAAAERGQHLFDKAGCASCHPPGLFTDLKQYDVGTRGRLSQGQNEFDTPTLVEIWRTAPYLHDGSAATIKDVLTTANKEDKHGKTSSLTEQELNDLAKYILSL